MVEYSLRSRHSGACSTMPAHAAGVADLVYANSGRSFSSTSAAKALRS